MNKNFGSRPLKRGIRITRFPLFIKSEPLTFLGTFVPLQFLFNRRQALFQLDEFLG